MNEVKTLLAMSLIVFALVDRTLADPDEDTWVVRYNGPANEGDRANSLAVDAYGNFYVTGVSEGDDTGLDYATVKYDPAGNQLWAARYDGPGNWDDRTTGLCVDVSGNVYVTGVSYGDEYGSISEYATVKYDSAGKQLWVACYNGTENWGHCKSLAVDAQGNVYVTGYSYGVGTSYDYATVKYDSAGKELWVARYNGPENLQDFANSLTVDADGNIYVSGKSYGYHTLGDYATVKYDSAGNQLWVARYNGPGNGDDFATSLAVDAQGNVYVTGYSYGVGTSYDYATVKYDSAGNQLWVARYNGPGNGDDSATSLALDANGNVYVTGDSLRVSTDDYLLSNDIDYATVKYDSAGNQLWVARYNGPGNGDDSAASLAVDANGNVYVTGVSYGDGTFDDYATMKYDSEGNQLWVARYGSPGNNVDGATSLALDANANVYVTGSTWGDLTKTDYLTIKNPHLLCFDNDGDGYDGNPSPACSSIGWDCNDSDPERNPQTVEACLNFVDDDCDGRVDRWDTDCAHVCYDWDGDGFGLPASMACQHSEEDCNDSSPEIRPGATEDCLNGIDDDCDGLVDLDDPDCSSFLELLEGTGSNRSDFDMDGLTNIEELNLWYSTYGIRDPQVLLGHFANPDVDGDFIPDGLEVTIGADPNRKDLAPPLRVTLTLPDWNQHSDSDGLTNGLEVMIFKTNPQEADTDGDGFDDGKEVKMGSDPTDVNSIPEYDGIVVGAVKMYWKSGRAPMGVNGVEVMLYNEQGTQFKVHTDPLFGRDGSFIIGIEGLGQPGQYSLDLVRPLPGNFEIVSKLPVEVEVKPYPPAVVLDDIILEGYQDADKDGVPDKTETVAPWNTDPKNPDTDGDGLPDGLEIVQRMNAMRLFGDRFVDYCCDPNDPGDKDGDPDKDSRTNLEEMNDGTDPNQFDSLEVCAGEDPEVVPNQTGMVKVHLESEHGDKAIQSVVAPSLIPDVAVGRVTSELTGAGIADARVVFYQGKGCPHEAPCELVRETASEDNGIFWSMLQSGDYWVKVCKEGYYLGEGTCQVKTGEPSDFVRIVLRPREPGWITPDIWAAFSAEEVRSEGQVGYAASLSSQSEKVDGENSSTHFIPLPVQLWGGVATKGVRKALATTAASDSEGEVSGRYQLDVSAEMTTGTTIARVEPEQLSRAYVALSYRPGDSVTAGAPGVWAPDGQVTEEDAAYVLGVVLGGEGYKPYESSLDLVPEGLHHDEEGKLVFVQDGRVQFEDALAVMRGAFGLSDAVLPENFRAFKQERLFEFRVASTSRVYIYDENHEPLGSSPIKGKAILEILSFPLDGSGSAFHIKSFHGETTGPVWIQIDKVPMPFVFEANFEQGEGNDPLGTIVWAQLHEGSYSFQIDNFYFDFDILLWPFKKNIYTFEDMWWAAKGSFMGGQNEAAPIKVYTGFSEMEGYIPSGETYGMAYFDLLVNLEYLPLPGEAD